MVVVKISETYDLNTVRNSVGVLGIHTPSAAMIMKMWPGFFQNYKFVRILHGNVKIACASYLPADPLQVGTTTGKIAPQDMFNPILYRAVSNESFETILATVYRQGRELLSNGSVSNDGPIYGSDPSDPDNPGVDQQWGIYYGFLSQPGWKKAMPQAGMAMNHLVPLVHTVLNSFGNFNIPNSAGDLNNLSYVDQYGVYAGNNGVARTFRGRVVKMPRIPTKFPSTQANNTYTNPVLPPVYCGCILMPPSKLNTLYYRLRVEWYVEFSVPRTVQAYSNYKAVQDLGDQTYYSSYDNASKDMDNVTDSIDTVGCDVEKVMES